MEEGDRKFLIDTGAPVSVSHYDKLDVLDAEYPTHINIAGYSCETVSKGVGMGVDGLLGCDILKQYDLVLDYKNGEICFFDPGTMSIDEAAIKMGLDIVGNGLMKFPATTVQLGERPIKVCFDTGANHSYINRNSVKGLKKHRDINDFNPSIGSYTTPLYIIPATLAGQKVEVEWAALHPSYDAIYSLGLEGIIGYDLLIRNKVYLSLSKNILSVIPN